MSDFTPSLWGWQEPQEQTSTSRRHDDMHELHSGSHFPARTFGRECLRLLNDELAGSIGRRCLQLEGELQSSDEQTPLQMPIKTEPSNYQDALRPAPAQIRYMQRGSSFAMHSSPDMSFLESFPQGDGAISYPGANGNVESISNLSPWVIGERCPLLAEAFESSRSGPQLYLEALNARTAMPFLRYLYTGSYAATGSAGDIYEDVPTSVLLHCELYRLGDIYDLLDLKQQANVNVTRQCEFGCSSSDKPIDLCAAVRYVYEHLPEHTGLIDTIICYCVTCFARHALADDFEFRTMAFELRAFHQDLCKECMKRDFEDEAAAAIIRMPFKPYAPECYASREDVGAHRFKDVVYHFHANDDFASAKKRKQPALDPQLSMGNIALALRSLRNQEQSTMVKTEETAFEDEVLDIDTGSSKSRLLIVTNPDPESPTDTSRSDSESGFELIPGAVPMEEPGSSDSDTDPESLVIVYPPSRTTALERSLPIRRRRAAGSSAIMERDSVNVGDSGSESEWTML